MKICLVVGDSNSGSSFVLGIGIGISVSMASQFTIGVAVEFVQDVTSCFKQNLRNEVSLVHKKGHVGMS